MIMFWFVEFTWRVLLNWPFFHLKTVQNEKKKNELHVDNDVPFITVSNGSVDIYMFAMRITFFWWQFNCYHEGNRLILVISVKLYLTLYILLVFFQLPFVLIIFPLWHNWYKEKRKDVPMFNVFPSPFFNSIQIKIN